MFSASEDKELRIYSKLNKNAGTSSIQVECVGVKKKKIIYIYIYIDIEDLALNSLHTTLVFRAEDKGVACPPLSSDMTEECSVAVPTFYRKNTRSLLRQQSRTSQERTKTLRSD